MTKRQDFYFNENTTLLNIIKTIGLSPNNPIVDVLQKVIFGENNYIGYAKFINNNISQSIFIFPKIISFYNTPKDNDKIQYILFLIDFFRLQKMYPEIKYKQLEFEFDINSIKGINFSTFFDSLLNQKFKSALNCILDFVKKTSPLSYIENNFSSSLINNKINIKESIRELNKSIIHQTEIIPSNKLDLLNLLYSIVLKFSLRKDVAEVALLSKYLLRMMQSKFEVKKIDTSIITKNSVKKLFKNNNNLYKSALILLGKESIFSDDENLKSENYGNIDFVFFDPKLIFEYFVYDYYINSGIDKNNIEYHKNYKYKLLEFKNDEFLPIDENLKSIPDFVIKNNVGCNVIDAKWKILKKGNPDNEDIIKLERDCDVLRSSSHNEIIEEKCLISPENNNQVEKIVSFSFNEKSLIKVKYIPILKKV